MLIGVCTRKVHTGCDIDRSQIYSNEDVDGWYVLNFIMVMNGILVGHRITHSRWIITCTHVLDVIMYIHIVKLISMNVGCTDIIVGKIF